MVQKNVAEQAFEYCEVHCGKTPEDRKAKGCPVFDRTDELTPVGTLCREAQKILGIDAWNCE